MFKVVTSRQMAVIDRNSEYLGVERLLLMENAGAAVAGVVAEHLGGSAEGRRVLVLCGPGNNGGDGMAAARHLAAAGAEVRVLLLAGEERVRTREARVNLEALKGMRLSVELITASTWEEVQRASELFKEAEVIVDAMLGTGVRGPLAGGMAEAVKLANESNALRVAVDVPTGVDPDTGFYETAFNPHVTVTLHAYKPALLNRPEKIVVADIGIPPEAEVIAGPGQVEALRREAKRGRPVIVYVYGDEGASEGVSKTLEALPCHYISMHRDMLVAEQEARQAAATADAILLDPSLQPHDVEPFTAKETPLILAAPTKHGGKAVYILRSGARHEKTREQLRRLQSRTKQLSTGLDAPVYVVGEVDAVAYREATYLNWLGTPLEEEETGQTLAVATYLIAKTNNPAEALAATSHILRTAPKEERQNPKKLAEIITTKIDG